tara:strand:- start:1135 stop:1524 length:390 start_codon:yes stop_codon:yes gene_type:complete
MSTEVKKSPQELAREFVMPKVELGAAVFFYPNHNLTHPHLAWIVNIGKTGKNVVLRTAERMVYDSVKHVDDPRLDWNVDHRESGSWDFTDEHKRLEREREDLKARVAALEHSAVKQVVKAAPKRKKTEE